MASVVGLCASIGAGQSVYDLRQRPKFATGDLITAACKRTSRISCAGSDNGRGYLVVTTTDSAEKQLISDVDKNGQVTSFTQHIDSARMRYTLKASGRPVTRTDINLGDVSFRAARRRNRFVADTTSVSSCVHSELNAPQLWLVKRLMRDRAIFHAFRAPDMVVMPSKPVPSGHSWRPPPDAIARWARSFALLRGVGIEGATGSFQLSAVKGRWATVKGSVTFGCRFRSMPARAKAEMSARIDTATGCWTRQSVKIELAVRSGENLLRLETTCHSEAVYQACKANGLNDSPKTLHSLGWKPSGETQTGRYQNRALGVSLSVPGNYKRKNGAKPGSVLFTAGDGRNISLSAKIPAVPVDLGMLTDAALRKLHESVPDYRLIRRERMSLPGDVPASLLTASGKGGTVIIFTIVAVDGPRIVSVTAAAFTGNTRQVDELKRIATSLCLFEPDLNVIP